MPRWGEPQTIVVGKLDKELSSVSSKDQTDLSLLPTLLLYASVSRVSRYQFLIRWSTRGVTRGKVSWDPYKRARLHRREEKLTLLRDVARMADKSAFVPVDAIGNHKNTDLDVDIDDELFGKKPPAAAAPAKSPAPPPPPPPKVSPAKPAPHQYKKSATYTKNYAK